MNSVSEPPINVKPMPGEKVTFADVAMRVARDGPMYMTLVLVGILALKGIADGAQAVLGAALALQARSFPGAIQTEKIGRVASLGILMLLTAAILSGSIIVACTER